MSTNKDRAIIIDIDGTLANINHRRKYVEKNPKEWNKFKAGLPDDDINKWCAILIQHLGIRYEVILCTGRMEDEREATVEWLKKYNIRYSQLFMRAQDDYRADDIVKEEIYENNIEPLYDIIFVIDDRKRVVDMWRKKGLVCLQCAEGNF